MKCERCGVGPKGLGLHDYCAHCSQNLCEKCAADGCCGEKPMSSGMAAEEAFERLEAYRKMREDNR